MFSGVLAEADGRLEQVLAELDPACLHGHDAKALLAQAVSIKRRTAALELVLARRVAESGAWRGEGDRSAAHWLARRTGMSVGRAISLLETAERLEELDKTAQAFRDGRLSEQQVEQVASGAGADPGAEEDLLKLAARAGVPELAERARAVRRAAAAGDEQVARHERIRRGPLRPAVDRPGGSRPHRSPGHA